MLPGARMLFEESRGVPYIMPDGDAYWDSGFVGGDGCEYRFDCLWIAFPQNTDGGGNREHVLMGGHIYQGIVACTFNTAALSADSLTTQGNNTEVRQPVGTQWLGFPSTIVAKHRVGDDYLRIGFDGGEFASVYRGSTISDSETQYICGNRLGGPFDGGDNGPMPDGKVMIFGISVSQNGQLVKNFVPWTDGGTPCFKETVGGALIRSLGSTTGKYGVWRS